MSTSLNLQPSDTLLIRGGSTSVGLAAATLAKTLLPTQRVISTTRSPKKTPALKSAGVDDVVVDSGNISDQVMKLTGGKGVDKCIELVGGTTLADSCASVGPKGTVSMTGSVSGEWTVKDFHPFTCLDPHKVLSPDNCIPTRIITDRKINLAFNDIFFGLAGLPKSAFAKNCGCHLEG